jgi:methylmalonyl-CoA mutase
MSTAAKDVPGVTGKTDTTPLRFVTAASLFDGHDAAINIMRRLIQAEGAEVIHLGHNRSVDDIVRAAIQEDADGIAVSSYQGGHVEFFKYMIDLLRARGAERIRVFGGGGGVIVPEEVRELQDHGVTRIYSPDDGQRMGLQGMIDDMLARSDFDLADDLPATLDGLGEGDGRVLARVITGLERGALAPDLRARLERRAADAGAVPALGVTGTGGSGKSSLTDELLNRFSRHFQELDIAVIAVDPTRRRTGGALLGDRIRMNSLGMGRIFMHSLATRRQHLATSAELKDIIQFLRFAGFGLIIVETAGIGQSDTEDRKSVV